ncbi:RICIN domain-containing protein [Actinoplanes sp. GCM10030250]|uniref:RICIN domain-containing protein n=1 Tax=Actinoplanes sp. GCM10030250 TaxID=3273376 RepID=UPI00360928E4
MTVRLGFVPAAIAATLLTIPAAAVPAKATTAAVPAEATTAAAVPAEATTAAAPGQAIAAETGVTVTIDPTYQQPEFEGWGTSLVWMAEATGGYPDAIRKRLADLVFGADGLNLNIARYNIGGGNAPTVKPYLRPGGAVEGFWKAPQQYGPQDKEWWNPDDPAHWNFDADPAQRWWIDQVKDRITGWEAFSNSPPWFQTVSGYVSGGFDANTDQIRADRVDQFAEYLVRVAEHVEKAHGITFDTIDPLNEPNTNYWGTTLGADGQPTGGRQEGAHAGPALQAQVVTALRNRLATASTGALVSAPDETNPGTFVTDWYGYPPAAQAAVSQLNVHTYGTGQRTAARDVAKAEQRPLWMSEVEGSWGNDYTSMNSGLGMAQRIIDDIRELEPSAWVLWQPIEDADNMVAEGNLQWGSIHVPFDCTAADTLETCPIRTNTKFDTIRNFTHFIHPGDRMVKVSDTATTAAIRKDGSGATAVHANPAATERAVTLDLSKFRRISRNARVTPVVTSAGGKLVRGAPVRVAGKRATITVPGESVTTFLIDGVSGARDGHVLDGHAYRLEGVQSGRSLTPSEGGAAIRTNDAAAADQLWEFDAAGNGLSNRERYVIGNAGTGQRLAARDGNVVVEDAAGPADEGAQWVLSTTGDGTYTLINVAARRLIDIPGQATSDGTRVALYQPTSGSNQRWVLRDETVVGSEVVSAYTIPGLVPQLPVTVTAILAGGGRQALPVTWRLPPERRWKSPGTVSVRGTATDVLGNRIAATAEVTVDVFTATEPARAKTFIGGTPELPATVTGLGRHGGRAELPVSWNALPAFPRPGVVTVTGTATVAGGRKLPATVRVQVTGPAEGGAAEPGTTVAATFTEGGYSAAGLVNGTTTDKAWSNWKPSDRNPSDTLTVTLPRHREVSRVVTHFYRDNASGGGLAQSLRAGTPAADGTCTGGTEIPVGPDSAPAVSAPLTATTDKVCVVLTAVPNGYLTVAEIEIFAKVPGVSSDARLTGIQVDGRPIPRFDPAVTDYRVRGRRDAVVTATAADPYAAVAVTGRGSSRTVTVTSEDASATTTYRVHLH